MAIRTKAALQTTFETGDKPTQQEFADLIDTIVAIPTANATGLVEIESTASSTTRAIGAFGVRIIGAATTASAVGHLNVPTTPVVVADGGTGATSAANARTNLGLVIGTDVLAPTGSGSSLTGIRKQGLETLWVPAVAMYAKTTNGAAIGSTETTTYDHMIKSFDFDQTTVEFVEFAVSFPKSWNLGTVTYQPYWTAASGTGDVVWSINSVALSNDDAIDTDGSGGTNSIDTLITAQDLHIGPVSSAVTIGGTPAASDWVVFELFRFASDGSDTLNADAQLLGVRLFFTTNAADDT